MIDPNTIARATPPTTNRLERGFSARLTSAGDDFVAPGTFVCCAAASSSSSTLSKVENSCDDREKISASLQLGGDGYALRC